MTCRSNLYILGAGGHGKSVFEVVSALGTFSEVYFLDDCYGDRQEHLGRPIVGLLTDWDSFLDDNSRFFVAIGSNVRRSALFDSLAQRRASVATLASVDAYISQRSLVGSGTLIMPKAVVNADVCIGLNVIVNSGAIVEHDCVIGDHSHVGPGAILTGGAKVGSATTIGAGAVVCPAVSVGDGVLLGAGAVATRDITQPGRYFGMPARRRGR